MIFVFMTAWVTQAEAASNSASLDDVFSILEEQRQMQTSIGSGVATKVSEAPTAAWVIDRATILGSGAVTIAELMRLIPGVAMQDSTQTHSLVQMRGSAGHSVRSFVLLLLDGRPINSPIGGLIHPEILPVPLSDIERIEVVIGPASMLYGANAYSGVINIVQRRAPKSSYYVHIDNNGGIGFAQQGGASRRLGAPGFIGMASGQYAQRFGNFGLKLSLGGNYLPAPVETETSPIALIMPDTSRRAYGTLSLDYQNGDWDVQAKLAGMAILGHWIDEISLYNQTMDYSATVWATKKNTFAADDALTLGAWLRGYGEDSVSFIPGVDNNLSRTREGIGEINAKYVSPSFFNNRIISGLQLRWAYFTAFGPATSIDPSMAFQHYYGLFVEDVYRPIQQLSLTAGIRAETRETSAWRPFSRMTFSPRAAIVVMPTSDHSLRLEYTTAFRNPTIAETSVTGYLFDGALNTLVPNPNVLAEQHQLFSFGYQGRIGPVSPRVELFYGLRNGEIQRGTVTPSSDLPGIYRNSTSTRYYGGSASLDAQATTWLRFFGHYTYVRNESRDGSLLRMTPQHVAGTGFFVTKGRVVASLGAYFQNGTMDTVSLITTEVETSHHIYLNPFVGVYVDNANAWQVYLAGTNVGDIRFGPGVRRDLPSYQNERVGPRVFAGLRYNVGNANF